MDVFEQLTDFPEFLDVSQASREKINQSGKISFLEENTTIINKGDKVSGAYLVLTGSLKVYTIDQSGKEKTLYEVLPGESCLLAINSLFSELLYPAWVDCTTPFTKIAFIPAAVYKAIFSDERSIQQFTFQTLSERLFDIMSTLDEAMSLSMEKRIVSYLLRKANHEAVIHTSHQKIASELGTAREVVSRTLKKIEHQGDISLSRNEIKIVSVDHLSKLLHEA